MWKNLLMGKKSQQSHQGTRDQPLQARSEPLADVSSSDQNRMRSISLPSNLDNLKLKVRDSELDRATFSAEAAAVTEEADANTDQNLSDGTTKLELNSNLYHLLSSLFGVSGNNSIVQLVAQKFNISEQLAGEITAWFKSRSKEIQLQNGIQNMRVDERDEEMESTCSGTPKANTKSASPKLTTEEERIRAWREQCLPRQREENYGIDAIPMWFEALNQADKEAIITIVREAAEHYKGDAATANVKADLVAKFRLTPRQADEIYHVISGIRAQSTSWATDYRYEVLESLFAEENEVKNPWRSMACGAQRDAYIASRVSAVEIMTEFATKYKLEVKTVEAAIRYLDRIMMSPNFTKIIKPCPTYRNATGSHSLYTVALCLLFISSKFEEIYPPQLAAFAKWCQSSSNMEQLETTLLEELKWDLSSVTPTDFIGQFHEAAHADRKTKSLSMFILESSYRCKLSDQVSGSRGKWNFFHKNGKDKAPPRCHLMLAKPSEIAISCLCLSLAYQGKISYTDVMTEISRASSVQLGPLVKELHEQLVQETFAHQPRTSPAVKKYSHNRYNSIGTFRPPSWTELVQHNAFRETEIVPNPSI